MKEKDVMKMCFNEVKQQLSVIKTVKDAENQCSGDSGDNR